MSAKKKTPVRKAAAKTKSAQPTKKSAAKKAPAKKFAPKKAARPAVRTVQAIPAGMTAITPHLICAGAAEAIEFYKQAFGAVEEGRMPGPGGKLMHGVVRIGGAAVMLVDEMPEWGCLGPKSLKGSPVTIHLYVADADATVAQAVKAGAKVVMPLSDMFWGDRYGKIEDPFGHQWSIGTHQRDVNPQEMQQAMQQMCDPAKAGT